MATVPTHECLSHNVVVVFQKRCGTKKQAEASINPTIFPSVDVCVCGTKRSLFRSKNFSPFCHSLSHLESPSTVKKESPPPFGQIMHSTFPVSPFIPSPLWPHCQKSAFSVLPRSRPSAAEAARPRGRGPPKCAQPPLLSLSLELPLPLSLRSRPLFLSSQSLARLAEAFSPPKPNSISTGPEREERERESLYTHTGHHRDEGGGTNERTNGGTTFPNQTPPPGLHIKWARGERGETFSSITLCAVCAQCLGKGRHAFNCYLCVDIHM